LLLAKEDEERDNAYYCLPEVYAETKDLLIYALSSIKAEDYPA
jgi:hypothetical protein